jgi:hypothetical protein
MEGVYASSPAKGGGGTRYRLIFIIEISIKYALKKITFEVEW